MSDLNHNQGFYLYGPRPESEASRRAYNQITHIRHARPVPGYESSQSFAGIDGTLSVEHRPHTTYQYPSHYAPEGEQRPLFEWEETPGRSVVDFVETTRQGSKHFPTMLGLAQQDTWRRFGNRMLEPSDDLSEHSAPIVEKLKGRGLVNPEAETKATNDMTFGDDALLEIVDSSVKGSIMDSSRHVGPDEARAARRMATRMMRQQRPSEQPVNEQLPLF